MWSNSSVPLKTLQIKDKVSRLEYTFSLPLGYRLVAKSRVGRLASHWEDDSSEITLLLVWDRVNVAFNWTTKDDWRRALPSIWSSEVENARITPATNLGHLPKQKDERRRRRRAESIKCIDDVFYQRGHQSRVTGAGERKVGGVYGREPSVPAATKSLDGRQGEKLGFYKQKLERLHFQSWVEEIEKLILWIWFSLWFG